ncbi:MAG: hypothetical protein WCG48_04100 [Candidatus Berkelbacteria bacterium]
MGKVRNGEREQTASVGNTKVTVKIIGGNFPQGVPSRFAKTIARNLDAKSLEGFFSGVITAFGNKSLGPGGFRAVHILPSNEILVLAQPDIPNSTSKCFKCNLRCPEGVANAAVLQAFQVKDSRDTIVVESDHDTEVAEATEATTLIVAGEPEIEEIAGNCTGDSGYPDLLSPRCNEALTEILQELSEYPTKEIPTRVVISTAKKALNVTEMDSAVFSRLVLGPVVKKEDGEEVMFVAIPFPGRGNRAYKLGQFALELLGKKDPVVKEELIETSKSEGAEAETPHPFAVIVEGEVAPAAAEEVILTLADAEAFEGKAASLRELAKDQYGALAELRVMETIERWCVNAISCEVSTLKGARKERILAAVRVLSATAELEKPEIEETIQKGCEAQTILEKYESIIKNALK